MEKIHEILQKYNCRLVNEKDIVHSSGKKINDLLEKNFKVINVAGTSIENRLVISLEEALKLAVGELKNG